MSVQRYWIGEVPARALKTVLIKAVSRKDAENKLRNASEYPEDIEGIDVSYEPSGIGKVICEDGFHHRKRTRKS